MPMMGDEKKRIGILSAALIPKQEAMDEGSEGSDEGLQVAAEEVLKALQNNSAVALKVALKDFVEICGSSYESELGEE